MRRSVTEGCKRSKGCDNDRNRISMKEYIGGCKGEGEGEGKEYDKKKCEEKRS